MEALEQAFIVKIPQRQDEFAIEDVSIPVRVVDAPRSFPLVQDLNYSIDSVGHTCRKLLTDAFANAYLATSLKPDVTLDSRPRVLHLSQTVEI